MWFNRNAKTDIREDMIEIEMSSLNNVHQVPLTKRFIRWLFRHYHVDEIGVLYYDLEDIPWDERISTNNWVDVFRDGSWGMTQRDVDFMSRDEMMLFKKAGHTNGRCWVGNRDCDGMQCLDVFLYGRDIHEFDIRLYMIPKLKRKGRRRK